MTDLLIRNVPDEDLHLLDHRAERLGMSRVELVRSLLRGEARDEASQIRLEISVSDFEIFVDLPDAADEDFIRRGWSHEA